MTWDDIINSSLCVDSDWAFWQSKVPGSMFRLRHMPQQQKQQQQAFSVRPNLWDLGQFFNVLELLGHISQSHSSLSKTRCSEVHRVKRFNAALGESGL